jgi:hypothetical protein
MTTLGSDGSAGCWARDVAVAACTGGTVDPARLRAAGEQWSGHWREGDEPSPFPHTPQGSVLGSGMGAVVRRRLEQFSATADTLGHIRDDDIEPAFRARLLGAFTTWR